MVQYIPNAGTTEVSDTGFTHLFMGFWHLWKYIDVTAGGLVERYPLFFLQIQSSEVADFSTMLFSNFYQLHV